jgi:hypothetical protein
MDLHLYLVPQYAAERQKLNILIQIPQDILCSFINTLYYSKIFESTARSLVYYYFLIRD